MSKIPLIELHDEKVTLLQDDKILTVQHTENIETEDDFRKREFVRATLNASLCANLHPGCAMCDHCQIDMDVQEDMSTFRTVYRAKASCMATNCRRADVTFFVPGLEADFTGASSSGRNDYAKASNVPVTPLRGAFAATYASFILKSMMPLANWYDGRQFHYDVEPYRNKNTIVEGDDLGDSIIGDAGYFPTTTGTTADDLIFRDGSGTASNVLSNKKVPSPGDFGFSTSVTFKSNWPNGLRVHEYMELDPNLEEKRRLEETQRKDAEDLKRLEEIISKPEDFGLYD